MRSIQALAVTLGMLCAAPAAWGQDSQVTPVMVRAVAHDAKIIGSSVGGARIVIQNAASGEILAEGVQTGGTGDTNKIVSSSVTRGESIYDTDGAAGFLAELAITSPTMVDITAIGPLNSSNPQRTTKRMLLVPGKPVLGDGIILELNGFSVEMLSPASPVASRAGQPLEVRAKVTLLCGCPTAPGGVWDADRYEISARLMQDGVVVAEAPMAFAGETSIYSGEITPPANGAYSLQVLASDPERANFGLDERAIVFGQ